MKTICSAFIILVILCLESNAQWALTATAPPATGPVHPLTSDGICLFGGSNCSTGSGNIFLTLNSGSTWTPTITGLPSFQFVSCIAFNGPTVFAGLATSGSGGLGIYKSINYGISWSPANIGLPNNAWVNALAVNGSNIFTGIGAHGVYKSTNNGNSWTLSSTGLSAANQFYSFTCIDSNIFVGTDVGVFRSTNNGNSWTPADNGLPNGELYFTMGSIGTNILTGTYGNKVYLSTDYGNSWNLAYAGSFWIGGFATVGSKVFLGADFNVLMSLDSGATWINTGYVGNQVMGLAATSSDLFASGATNVWKIPLAQLTGIEQNEFQPILSIAPNPFDNRTTIYFNEEQNNLLISITDISGKEVMTKSFSGKQFILEKGELKEGVYFVRITDEKKNVANKKIVIQ